MTTWTEFWALFHRRWGSDHESPEYVKAEWGEMQGFLQTVETPRKRAMDADTQEALSGLLDQLAVYIQLESRHPLVAEVALANVRDQANRILLVSGSAQAKK